MESSLRIFLCVCTVQQAAGAAKHGAEAMGARVVIHVGPHKTGTKSVQYGLHDQESLLKVDAWTMPSPDGLFGYRNMVLKGGKQIADMYVRDETRQRNKSEYHRWLATITQLKGTTNNMVLSCETFAKANERQLAELAFDLIQTTTTIVMVYRPYYEWIASIYRQIHGADNGASPNSTEYVDWLFPPNGSRSGSTSLRRELVLNISAVYRRYAAHFSDIRIHTLGPNLVTEIICDDLDATRTCAAVRKSTMDQKHISPKGSLAAGCLSHPQLQSLKHVSVELHKEMFGSLVDFSKSDLHDQARRCFGNR